MIRAARPRRPWARRGAFVGLAVAVWSILGPALLPVGSIGSVSSGMPRAWATEHPAAELPAVGLPAAGRPTADQTPATATSIVLTAVTPAVATPGQVVVITGSIAPLPGRHYVDPTVRVIRARALSNRDEVQAWSGQSGPTGPVNGTEVARVVVPGTVATGGRVPFRITVPADAFRQRAAVAAVPIALQLNDASGSTGGGIEALHTFVGWQRTVEYTPLAVSWLVPLTVDPDPALYAADPATRTAAWTGLLGDAGRPARSLRGVQGRPVDLAIDPALFGGGSQPAGRPGGSATVATPAPNPAATTATPGSQGPTPPTTPASPGTTAPTPSPGPTPPVSGDPSDPVAVARESFARAVTTASAGRQVLALPYADPDLAALATVLSRAPLPAPPPSVTIPTAGVPTVGTPAPSPSTPAAGTGGGPSNPDAARTALELVTDLLRAPDQLADRLQRSVVTGFAWPTDGALPAGRELALRAAYGPGLQTILAGQRATGSTDATPTAPATGAAGTAVLRWDDRLSELFTAAALGPADAALAAQEFVAESVTLLMERPSTARSVLVVAPRGLSVDPGSWGSFLDVVTALPWLRATPVTQAATIGSGPRAVLPSSVPTPDPAADPSDSIPPSPVSAAVVDTLVAQRVALADLAQVLPARTRLPAPWTDLSTQLVSTRWRGAGDRHAATLQLLTTGVARLGQGLTVSPQTTNFLADEGVLLVTVVNDLDEPVSGLRLVLTPGNARMRVVETPASVDIEARSKATVPVRLAAVAQGVVPFSALLTTRTGAPVGVAGTIEVRAAPPGAWLYVAFGGALGVILIVGVVRSLRRPSKVQTDIALDPVEPTPEPPWPHPLDLR